MLDTWLQLYFKAAPKKRKFAYVERHGVVVEIAL